MGAKETGGRTARGGGGSAGSWDRAAVRAALARHGVALDADEATLQAILEARGWEARVEEVARPGGAPVVRAVARRSMRGRGRTAAVALARVLARVLEQGGEGRERAG